MLTLDCRAVLLESFFEHLRKSHLLECILIDLLAAEVKRITVTHQTLRCRRHCNVLITYFTRKSLVNFIVAALDVVAGRYRLVGRHGHAWHSVLADVASRFSLRGLHHVVVFVTGRCHLLIQSVACSFILHREINAASAHLTHDFWLLN